MTRPLAGARAGRPGGLGSAGIVAWPLQVAQFHPTRRPGAAGHLMRGSGLPELVSRKTRGSHTPRGPRARVHGITSAITRGSGPRRSKGRGSPKRGGPRAASRGALSQRLLHALKPPYRGWSWTLVITGRRFFCADTRPAAMGAPRRDRAPPCRFTSTAALNSPRWGDHRKGGSSPGTSSCPSVSQEIRARESDFQKQNASFFINQI